MYLKNNASPLIIMLSWQKNKFSKNKKIKQKLLSYKVRLYKEWYNKIQGREQKNLRVPRQKKRTRR